MQTRHPVGQRPSRIDPLVSSGRQHPMSTTRKNNPLTSVMITCSNGADCLPECIRSVTLQEASCEIIVYDGSTDLQRAVCLVPIQSILSGKRSPSLPAQCSLVPWQPIRASLVCLASILYNGKRNVTVGSFRAGQEATMIASTRWMAGRQSPWQSLAAPDANLTVSKRLNLAGTSTQPTSSLTPGEHHTNSGSTP